MNVGKKLLLVLSVLLLVVQHPVTAKESSPKKVIFMIMDGTNTSALTLSRWYKGKPLVLDSMLVGGVRTSSLTSAITDSAAAATGMATGMKTTVNKIGMVPNGSDNYVPKENILELSQRYGYATGIVSTSPVQHATPAAFSSHVTNRNQYDDIGEQQVYQKLDVVLGGGRQSLHNTSQQTALKKPSDVGSNMPSLRKDGQNLIPVIKRKGYQYVETKQQLETANGKKIWGSFSEIDISNEMDRNQLTPTQPSLAVMTKKAIQTLNQNKKGFFLFVEGSKIDWAAHKHDPIGMISETLAFDDAVNEALTFAKKDKNTLVIALTDHGNSGLSIGNHDTDKSYAVTPTQKYIAPLKKAKMTAAGIASLLQSDKSNLDVLIQKYGLTNLSVQQKYQLRKSQSIEKDLGNLMAQKAHLGFTTNGHTGEDVLLYAYGPDKPYGLIENTDLPKLIAKHYHLSSSFQQGTKTFVSASAYYKQKGYQTKIVHSKDKKLLFTATKNKKTFVYSANTDTFTLNNKIKIAPGISFYNKEQHTFYITKP